MRKILCSIAILWLTLGFSCFGVGKSLFEQPSAQLTILDGKIKYLQTGCKLYADKDYTLKNRPHQLSSTRYVMGRFDGCRVRCDREGVAFLLALVDPINQEQTKAVLTFVKENQWNLVQEIPQFVLFYANGADRPARVYWKVLARGQEMICPSGCVLCFRYKQ